MTNYVYLKKTSLLIIYVRILIDGPDTIGLGEIHIQILIIRIEQYGDILMLVKFETNWIIRLREYI